MKRFKNIILGAAFLLSTLLVDAIEAKAYEYFEDSQGVEYAISSDNSYCSAYVSEIDNLSIITIPEQVTYDGNSYTVNKVSLSETESTSLTQINIPATVVKLSCYLKPQLCPNLDKINVDENNAVYCSDDNGWVYNKDKTVLYFISLASEHIVIPDGVKKIECDFNGSERLISVEMSDSVETIGTKLDWGDGSYSYTTDPLFIGCVNLTSVKLSEGLTEIPEAMFDGCTSLTEVKIPSNVTMINSYAFWNCSSLESIELPEALNYIGKQAFYKCSSLKSLTVPSNLKTAELAFDNSGLETVTFQDGATVVPLGMFEYCYTLKEVNLPSTIEEIGARAFDCCSSLKSITIPQSVTKIDKSAFLSADLYEGYVLTIYGYTGSYAEKYAKENGIAFVSIDSQGDENTDTTNPSDTNKTDVNQPTTEQTEKLPEVGTKTTLSSGQYKVSKSSATSKEVTFVKPKSSKKTSVAIPATVKIDGYTYKVTEIASKAFKNNKKIKSVTIGKNVKKIGKEAFYNCKKLKKITIKSTVLKSVGKNAVKNIDKKATIKVPKSKLKKYKSLFKSKTGYKKTMKIKK